MLMCWTMLDVMMCWTMLDVIVDKEGGETEPALFV